MTLEQLKELQQLSYEWSRYSGLNKKSDIETLLDLNREIQEAWEIQEVIWGSQSLDFDFDNNFEDAYLHGAGSSFESELADIFLILVRRFESSRFEYVLRVEKAIIINRKTLAESLRELKSDSCAEYKLATILAFCNNSNIDLYSHVKLKLRYNYTRKEYKK